jgi:hypothetical protein
VSEPKTTARLLPYAGASAAVCAIGIAVSLLLPAEARSPALFGTIAAAIGGLCGLAALAGFVGNGTNGVFAGFTVGFLCRIVLVAAGLLLSGARGNLALVYVGAFFTLYAATQVVEILFVHSSTRRPSGATP